MTTEKEKKPAASSERPASKARTFHARRRFEVFRFVLYRSSKAWASIAQTAPPHAEDRRWRS